MGFAVENIPAAIVFLQGLLSFFSPCVLPLVPLYIGYLAGGARTTEKDGTIHYDRKKVFLHTLFFVFGVSFAFFALGFGFTTLGRFFSGNRMVFARIGGILVILFGLFQLGVFGSHLLNQEHRLSFRFNQLAMTPVVALLLGFTFSFAWTPCVGPALASVLLLASSAQSAVTGFFLIAVYTLGFVIPFLAVGFFTSSLLEFFRKHQQVVQYTAKMGGVLMIAMGVMMVTGWMNGVTGYLSRFGTSPSSVGQGEKEKTESKQIEDQKEIKPQKEETEQKKEEIPAPDFTLKDQTGTEHTLSDYKGKIVFLNFWATWCPPCKNEMPDIQALYEKYGENAEDLIVLGIANPRTDEFPYNQDVTEGEVIQFLADGGYTYPVVMDLTGEIFIQYGISSFPTTFMIDENGNVFGYIKGMLTSEMMESIVQQTIEGKRTE